MRATAKLGEIADSIVPEHQIINLYIYVSEKDPDGKKSRLVFLPKALETCSTKTPINNVIKNASGVGLKPKYQSYS